MMALCMGSAWLLLLAGAVKWNRSRPTILLVFQNPGTHIAISTYALSSALASNLCYNTEPIRPASNVGFSACFNVN